MAGIHVGGQNVSSQRQKVLFCTLQKYNFIGKTVF